MSAGWHVGCARSAVYWLVRGTHQGATARDVARALCPAYMHERRAESMLYQLKRDGYIDQPAGKHSPYAVTDACLQADVAESEIVKLLPPVLAELDDCEAGVSVRVLAEELDASPAEVHACLLPMLARGQVRRILMQGAGHDDIGYCLVRNVHVPQAVVVGAVPNAAGQPVCPQAAFALLPDGRFEIAVADVATVRLPPEVTRAMFSYLDALGGLKLAQALAQAGGQTQCG